MGLRVSETGGDRSDKDRRQLRYYSTGEPGEQVPYRSPFRYPGGKTWLVPKIRRWLASLPRPSTFVEPFAGGAIVGLTVAFEDLANRVVLVELDDKVASVWKTVLSPSDSKWLMDQVSDFDITKALTFIETEAKKSDVTLRSKALQAIVENRINRGGILAPGAGRLNRGENEKGLSSRWYPDALVSRIHDISETRERIRFIQGDGIKLLRRTAHREDFVYFLDPPYSAAVTSAGGRLYSHFEIDHTQLFELASTLAGDFLMTYDDTPEVRNLAHTFGFSTHAVAMRNTHNAKKTELLVGPNLRWA